MTQRTATLDKLVVYFNEIGQILKPHEYRLRTDTPIRFARVRSIFGSWNRMENLVRKHNARNEKSADYVPPTNVDAILNGIYTGTQTEVDPSNPEVTQPIDPEPKPEICFPEPTDKDPKKAAEPAPKKG